MMLWGWNFVPFKSAINNLQTQVDELRADLDAHINAEPEPEPEPEPVPFPGIQAAYDALPAGATELVIPAGTYTEELTLNRANIMLVTDSPGEVTIIGRVRLAADGAGIGNGITVREGTNRSPQYWGTVWSDGVNNLRVDCVVTGSEWSGIALKGGTGHRLHQPIAHENGALGIRLDSVDDVVITSPTCFANNTRGLDPGWEAGGIKIIGNYGGVRNVQAIDGHYHHNDGPGIWFDVDAEDCLVTRNRVHHNTRAGIIYELSSHGTITNNVIYENGWGFRSWGFGAGILIQNSKDCDVFDNVLAWNGDGIVVISQDRGEARWNEVMRNQVDSNVIAHEDDNEQWGAFAGAVLEDWGGVATGPLSGNTGTGNQYYFTRWTESEPSAGNGVWILRGRNGSEGYYGVPEVFNGTVLDQSEIEAVLTEAGIPLEPEAR